MVTLGGERTRHEALSGACGKPRRHRPRPHTASEYADHRRKDAQGMDRRGERRIPGEHEGDPGVALRLVGNAAPGAEDARSRQICEASGRRSDAAGIRSEAGGRLRQGRAQSRQLDSRQGEFAAAGHRRGRRLCASAGPEAILAGQRQSRRRHGAQGLVGQSDSRHPAPADSARRDHAPERRPHRRVRIGQRRRLIRRRRHGGGREARQRVLSDRHRARAGEVRGPSSP